jgi:putative acetyltransferase
MIRQYVDTDNDQAMEIFKACLLSHDFILDNDRADQIEDMKGYVSMFETYVYERKGKIIGFMSLIEDDNNLTALYVSPDFWNRGIGSELVEFAKSKSDSLQLEVYRENARAVAFYGRAGFKVNDTNAISQDPTKIMMLWKRE